MEWMTCGHESCCFKKIVLSLLIGLLAHSESCDWFPVHVHGVSDLMVVKDTVVNVLAVSNCTCFVMNIVHNFWHGSCSVKSLFGVCNK